MSTCALCALGCLVSHINKPGPIRGSKIANGLQRSKVLVNWGQFNEKFYFEKVSQSKGKKFFERKLKRGTFWDFQRPCCRKTPKKMKGALGDNFFSKKCPTMPEKTWDLLVSPGIVCYAEKRKNLFGSVPWANRYILATF